MLRLLILGACYFFVLQILPAQFVRLENSKFMLGDSVFTPLIMNYGVNIRHDGDACWISRAMSYYTHPSKYNCRDEQDCYDDLLSDLKLIRSKGFNTIRIFNFEYGVQSAGEGEGLPATTDISYYYSPLKPHPFVPPFEDHFILLDKLVSAARLSDLKIILLTGGKNVEKSKFSDGYRLYLEHLARHFRDEPAIMAYDLINEPSYFAKGPRKKEINLMVRGWSEAIRNQTAHHLITMGLGDATTTFDWDPAMLDVDFFSYHLYPDEQGDPAPYMDQVYYFSKISPRPWIIGETGFAASAFETGKRVDGNLRAQGYFLSSTYQYCRDCGGIAYSWWQYHDVTWSPDYGMVDSLGRTKPFCDIVPSLASYDPDPSACQPSDGYRQQPAKFKNFYTGQVLDKEGRPLENALVVASSLGGAKSHTYSRSDGSYTVFSRGTISTVRITAAGYGNRRRSVFFSNTTTRLRKLEGASR